MSGGYFDGSEYHLEDIASEIEKVIAKNNQKNEWGYSTSFSEETLAKFQETVLILDKASKMVQRVDYLIKGDDSEESFRKRWQKEVIDKFNPKA